MTVAISKEKCTKCGKCCELCPGDLLRQDSDGRAYILDSSECWDCAVCVKECPSSAIKTVLPFQMANRGATLQPKVFADKIEWTLTRPDGKNEVFTIKTGEI